MTPIEYTDYFRQMAVRHNLLRHNPMSETGDAAVGEKHFGRFGAEEVIEGLRTKMDWPALMIEMFEVKTNAEAVYAIKGNYYGAFSVFATASPTNLNEQEQAYQITLGILQDVLAQIYQDRYGPDASACTSPFRTFNFDTLNITSVGPIFDKQFGWRCEFEFEGKNGLNINTPPAQGTFL